MKYFIVILFCIILFGCTIEKPSDPCSGLPRLTMEEEYKLASCYENLTLNKMNVTYCNYIPKEVTIKGQARIYSKSTCRNLYEYKIAMLMRDPSVCELIDKSTKLYAELPPNATIKNSMDLRDICRETITVQG
jgi:hypothetical protein